MYHHQLPQALEVFASITESSAVRTLRSATSQAAVGLGISSQTGCLKPGLAADLLVVDGDPLVDLSVLTRPVEVWARGWPQLSEH